MSVEKVFNKSADEFDQYRKKLIPCYKDFYEICLDVIPFHGDRELRVLDLGAGTGLLTIYAAARYPLAQFTLLDVSSEMLSVAEKRLKKTENPGRFSILKSDFSTAPLQGQFDLVMSSLAIHHLDGNQKQELFEKVFSILAPGGVFINADQVLGENEMAEKKFRHTWLEQVKKNGVPKDILEKALERMEEDQMSTLSDQLMWLEKTKFIDVTCWYQYYSFVVYSGVKPLAP